MLNKIYLYIGIALAAIAAAFGIRAKIRSDAKDEERQRQQQEVINAARDRKKIDSRVDGATDNELDDLLQPPKR